MTADQIISNYHELLKRGETIVWSDETVQILIQRIFELEEQLVEAGDALDDVIRDAREE